MAVVSGDKAGKAHRYKKRKKATDDNRSRQNGDQGMRAKDRRVREKVTEKVV